MKTTELKKTKQSNIAAHLTQVVSAAVLCLLGALLNLARSLHVSFAVVGPDLELMMQGFLVTGFSLDQQFPDNDTETPY